MKVVQFTLDVNYANIFLAFEARAKAAFLVDCGAFPDSVEEFIREQGLQLKFLLVTHSHYDHVDGIDAFRKRFDAPIYSAAKRIGQRVSDGDTIDFAGRKIRVLATPGHIADGVSFAIGRAVFVGDAIFSGAVGGTANRKNFEEEIRHVRDKIFSLPDDTVIYPGHGAPTLVGIERLYNPFFN